MTEDRSRKDECPKCGGIGGETFVLGHHYCHDCELKFTDDGKIIGDEIV